MAKIREILGALTGPLPSRDSPTTPPRSEGKPSSGVTVVDLETIRIYYRPSVGSHTELHVERRRAEMI